jgi:hypothetical protein
MGIGEGQENENKVRVMTYMRWWDSIEKTLRDAIDRWMYLDWGARSIDLECMFEYKDFERRHHVRGALTS